MGAAAHPNVAGFWLQPVNFVPVQFQACQSTAAVSTGIPQPPLEACPSSMISPKTASLPAESPSAQTKALALDISKRAVAQSADAEQLKGFYQAVLCQIYFLLGLEPGECNKRAADVLVHSATNWPDVVAEKILTHKLDIEACLPSAVPPNNDIASSSSAAAALPVSAGVESGWMEAMFDNLRPACKTLLGTFWRSDKAAHFKVILGEECAARLGHTSKMGFMIAIGNALRDCGEHALHAQWVQLSPPQKSGRKGNNSQKTHTANWKTRVDER